MKTFSIPFGKGFQTVELPEEKILYDIQGNPVDKTAPDIEAETRRVLEHPIDSRPLREIVKAGEKVAVICSDLTRLVHTKEFLPVIVDVLNKAGIPDEDITLVVATGTHRAHTHDEDVEIYGEEMVRRLKIHQHDCRNREELEFLGTTRRGTPVWIDTVVTRADRVIVTGGVSIHPFAGFGGGRKAIVPGVAGIETVNHNHLMALADEVGGGCEATTEASLLEGNRVHEDMTEAAAMLNPDFLVNTVFTPEGELYETVAGNFNTAFLKGCHDLLRLAGVHIKELADVVIASAGGAPKDTNLYQGTKSHMNATFAVKKGGVMIQVLECPDIKEPAIFTNWLVKSEPLQFEKDVRADFSIPAFVAFKSRMIINSCTTYLVTRPENFAFVKESGQIPCATLEEAWKLAQEVLKKQGKADDYTITIMTHAAATLPILDQG